MKVFLVGATGRVATAAIEELLKAGHKVIAAARKPERVELQEDVLPLAFDLTASPEEMAQFMNDTGAEAIINVSGSGGRDVLGVDLYGAVKLMQAAKIAGIKRFVHLSTIFALEPKKWIGPGFDALKDYYIAKHFADLYLTENIDLDYTILQPGALTEEEATGKITVNDDVAAANTIPDVAATLVAILDAPNTIGKVISMHNGDQEISQAIAEV